MSTPSQTQPDFQAELAASTDIHFYDPSQSLVEKRQVRQEYRQLIASTEEKGEELASLRGDGIAGRLTEANTLYDRVKGTYEATLDSRLLVLSADIAASRARALRLGEELFDGEALARKIALYAGDHAPQDAVTREEVLHEQGLQWGKVGVAAIAAGMSRAPTSSFLLGPLSVQLPVRRTQAPRAPRARIDDHADTQPQQLGGEGAGGAAAEGETAATIAGGTTKLVTDLYHLLEQAPDPIPFFPLVCHPQSFGQTVENIFHLSFLVRDGKVDIDMDSGEPLVGVCEPPTHADYEEGLVKKQLIMPLDPPLWMDLCRHYGLEGKEPMIPHREDPEMSLPTSSAWY